MVATLTFRLMIWKTESAMLKFQSQALGKGCFYRCPMHREVLHNGCTASRLTWQSYQTLLKECMVTLTGCTAYFMAHVCSVTTLRSKPTLAREQLAGKG